MNFYNKEKTDELLDKKAQYMGEVVDKTSLPDSAKLGAIYGVTNTGTLWINISQTTTPNWTLLKPNTILTENSGLELTTDGLLKVKRLNQVSGLKITKTGVGVDTKYPIRVLAAGSGDGRSYIYLDYNEGLGLNSNNQLKVNIGDGLKLNSVNNSIEPDVDNNSVVLDNNNKISVPLKTINNNSLYGSGNITVPDIIGILNFPSVTQLDLNANSQTDIGSFTSDNTIKQLDNNKNYLINFISLWQGTNIYRATGNSSLTSSVFVPAEFYLTDGTGGWQIFNLSQVIDKDLDYHINLIPYSMTQFVSGNTWNTVMNNNNIFLRSITGSAASLIRKYITLSSNSRIVITAQEI